MEVRKLYSHIPETIRVKEKELGASKCRLANFVEFIGEGRGSQALSKALVETEHRVAALEEELEGLHRSTEKVFQAPPVEWVEERLSRLRSLLERRTEKSALILRKLLGRIHLEPIRPDTGRPHYVAHSSMDTLVLLRTPETSEYGSNCLRW